MTAPDHTPRPGSATPPPSSNGSVRLGAIVVIVFAVAAVFAAGLSIGSRIDGRDEEERAALSAFQEAYRTITDDFVGAAEPAELIDAAIEAMFDTLDDPYSAFLSGESFSATLSGITGEFEGIGARMTTQDASGAACELIDATCRLLVVEVLGDSPAEEAGLARDDLVVGVDERSLDELTIDDAILLIRGPRGSEVTLSLLRDGSELPLTITRDVIRERDVRSEDLADGTVGYLRIDGFGGRADDDFRRELQADLDADIDRLIIDLRGNPGGFVDTALAIASEFVGSGPIMWEEDADGRRESYEARSGGLATGDDVEVVVLVDGRSASASEIVAGALQDAGRATVVGERTFGKGSVQEWTPLPGGTGGIRLSVARWLTRGEASIDGVGVAPDVRVGRSGPRYQPGGAGDPTDDPQLSRALALLAPAPAADRPAPGAAPSPGPI